MYYLVNNAVYAYNLNPFTASPTTTENWTYLGFYGSSARAPLIPEIQVTNNAGLLQVSVFSNTDVSGHYEIWVEASLDYGETEINLMSEVTIYFIGFTPISPYTYTLRDPYTLNVQTFYDIQTEA